MAKKHAKGDEVAVTAGRHKGRTGVVTGHRTGWVFDTHMVKLDGVDRPVRLTANVLRAHTPRPASGLDTWLPGQG